MAGAACPTPEKLPYLQHLDLQDRRLPRSYNQGALQHFLPKAYCPHYIL
jgi:hypothetical protein